MGSAKATGARRPRSRSTSTIPAIRCMAISSSRYSTTITTSAAFCRSTSMKRQAVSRWRGPSARARRRPGKEVRTVLKHVIKRIRRHWPKVHILVRGDSHYGRDEAMEWCEETQGVDYVFGFAGNDVLHALTREAADAIAVQRALSGEDKLRGFKAFRYGAGSWHKERRFVARIEATSKGLDVRYVVTSLKAGARHLYETLYCARGNAENFINLH